MSDSGNGDFEFERRFFVREVPSEALAEPDPVLIVQSYYLADQGFALRLRVQSSTARIEMDGSEDVLDVLDEFAGQFDFCALTAKGPMIEGTRYEAEREIDVSVGVEMIRRGGARIVKNRYSVWLGGDGWVIDVFGGANRPLVIAECERGGPVTDLTIPAFCVSEVTGDRRFSNDALATAPFSGWAAAYAAELAEQGPHFLQGLGVNRFERR
ncbi:CYTH domain-containing protein [Cellulomonas cellasea]|uniref:CYTH domain-containing protein n=1 Tax=Cellulomonas cellasea TaxID=43670 RepID=UPI0025A3F4EF|nr:CYTH domain-containing protein [Cellulomonas cellasea]MDM8084909.1 CYTH domain-containing protein [Cellulomonas cellasea]